MERRLEESMNDIGRSLFSALDKSTVFLASKYDSFSVSHHSNHSSRLNSRRASVRPSSGHDLDRIEVSQTRNRIHRQRTLPVMGSTRSKLTLIWMKNLSDPLQLVEVGRTRNILLWVNLTIRRTASNPPQATTMWSETPPKVLMFNLPSSAQGRQWEWRR